MIQLQTFGAVYLRRDGTDVRSVLSQPKRLALLAYLATEATGAFVSRERLLGLFWPEADAERARNALRQSLHYLRRSLGAEAVIGRGDRELGVDPGELGCDAVAFTAAVEGGSHVPALEIYRGEFLSGLHVDDAPDIERWIEDRRAQFRRAAIAAARTAAEIEEQRGDLRAATLFARRSLDIDPLDEASLRHLLRLLEAGGERAAGVQTFDDFKRRLGDELGLEPSGETLTLGERLRTSVIQGGQAQGDGTADFTTALAPASHPDRSVSTGRRGGVRWTGISAATVVLAVLVLALLLPRTADVVTPASSAEAPAIAVLPFVNMSGDPAQEYFSDGMAEELMTALARVPGLRVVARTSAFSFKGRQVGVDSIGRALRVAHVLEGSVRMSGTDLRVTAKLVDAATGYQVWADTYQGSVSDAFAVQDAIAREIVVALEPRLAAAVEEVEPETTDPQAYADVLQGLATLRLDAPEAYARADTFFRRAVERDPRYGRAWAGIARVRLVDAYRRLVPGPAGYGEARALAERAITLDPRTAAAHVVLGRVAEDHDWDFGAAERHYRRALELAPSDEVATFQLSRLLAHLGRADESIRLARRALDLDPLAPIAHRWLGSMLMLSGRHEQAVEVLETTLALSPDHGLALISIASALSELDRHAEAVGAAERAVEHTPGEQLFVGTAAWINARAGNADRARELLARIEASPRPAFYYRAMAYAGLGESERALEMLERAVAERESFLPQVGTQPAFVHLRSERRFEAILREVGLGPARTSAPVS